MASTLTHSSDEALLNPPPLSQHTAIYKDTVPDDDMSITDNQSEASTVQYAWDDHESFTTYQHKIRAAAANHLNCPEHDVQVEHMKGGAYNRVAALIVRKAPRKLSLQWFKSQVASCFGRRNDAHYQHENFIFRVPREHDDVEIRGDVVMTQLVGYYCPLPVPEIIAFDITKDNALKNPHMIQKRLEGQPICKVWSSLNFEQKRSIVKDVSQMAPMIASTFHGPSGLLSHDNLSTPKGSPIVIKKFYTEKFQQILTPPNQTSLEHLLDQCARHSRVWEHFSLFWDNFIIIAHSLHKRGFLDGAGVLVHGDLGPHNILASIASNTEVKITGVIDWDMAFIAPSVLAYQIPSWLWTDDPETSDEARIEDRPATTPELQLIKDEFLASVSDEDKKFYFSPEALLARRMYHIMKDGVPGEWDVIQAQNVLRDWAAAFPEDGVEVVTYTDEEEYRNRTYDNEYFEDEDPEDENASFEVGDGEDDDDEDQAHHQADATKI